MKIDFQNTEVAFRSKSNLELYQAYLLFKAVGSSRLVSFGAKILHQLIKTPIPFDPLLKASLFKQFCGGENAVSCAETIRKLSLFNVGTVLDYSIEGAQKESVFDATEKELMSNLTLASQSTHVPFSVFKVTGLVRFSLLEKLHEKTTLTSEENKEWASGKKRIRKIIQKASELGIKVLIDAEESWIQNPIDELVEELMKEFNSIKPVVYHTLQMYRTDRLDYLYSLLELSKKNGFILALKFVRGAYMEKERERAEKFGYSSPIQPDKNATDSAFNQALSILVKEISRSAIFAGTHNEASTQYLVDLMEEAGIKPSDERVCFSQLLGMSDNLTFNLATHGFRVVKYVPYGPVRELTPYLIRRAQENSAISGQTLRELELISRELQRRKNSRTRA